MSSAYAEMSILCWSALPSLNRLVISPCLSGGCLLERSFESKPIKLRIPWGRCAVFGTLQVTGTLRRVLAAFLRTLRTTKSAIIIFGAPKRAEEGKPRELFFFGGELTNSRRSLFIARDVDIHDKQRDMTGRPVRKSHRTASLSDRRGRVQMSSPCRGRMRSRYPSSQRLVGPPVSCYQVLIHSHYHQRQCCRLDLLM